MSCLCDTIIKDRQKENPIDHIKNVVLVISDDSYIRTLSKRIREYYGPLHNLNISEIVKIAYLMLKYY